jgi:alkylation response protein AidB-like acyl-CoA dehydrogenase
MISQDASLQVKLAEHAGWLNDGTAGRDVGESLTQLATAGYLGLGVSAALGGTGGNLLDVVQAIATVSEQCLTSGFVFWCQRAFIEYVVASDNDWLQAEILPRVLKAELSGATGLSNAMKFLAGIEQLRLQANLDPKTVTLNGFLPWASNLQPGKFVVAIAAQTSDGRSLVVAVPASAGGLTRGEDLQLLGLQASWTSTLRFDSVQLPHQWIISDHATTFLPKIRPAFLLMQCGLAWGMARRSLHEITQSLNAKNGAALSARFQQNSITLLTLEAQLRHLSSIHANDFALAQARQLFELRIALTRLAVDFVQLELEAKGGAAYLKPSGTARRLREVAFLPVLTPSLVQLETELHRHAQAGNLV